MRWSLSALIGKSPNARSMRQGDKGTVFELKANDSTLRGLHLTGSGDSHDSDDSCLDVRGHRATIENLTAGDLEVEVWWILYDLTAQPTDEPAAEEGEWRGAPA